jgi:DNA-binding response OmpR family regulator
MPEGPTVIVVEDEPITRAQLRAHLEEAGHAVLERGDGEDLTTLVDTVDAELLLLDISLPGADGLTLAREIRARSDIGIILVTGRDEQIDRLEGLESGADDYVTKPFDPRELLTRARNLVRRVQAQRQRRRIDGRARFAGWVLDLDRRELLDPEGSPQHLSAGEFQLLRTFVEHAGEVLTRDRIMNLIRNREWYPDDRYIDVLVGQLRRKLGETASTARLITTIHGTGYLFAAEVS